MDSTRPKRNTASDQRPYENFEPSMDWVREPAADTLRVYLPGYKKEQLKVQVTSSRYLRVIAERPLGDTNRISQFRKEIPIASNYDPNKITAKFENDFLLIRHPKIIVPDNEPQQQNVIQQQPKPPAPPSKETPKPPKPPVNPPKPTVKPLQPADVEAPKPQKPPAEPPSKPAEVDREKSDRVNEIIEKGKDPNKYEATRAGIKPDNVACNDVACYVQDNRGRGITSKLQASFYDTVMKLKRKPTNLMNWAVVVFVVVIGIYAMKAIKSSSSKSDN